MVRYVQGRAQETHHRMKGQDVMHNKIDVFHNKSAFWDSYYNQGRVNTQIQRWEVLMLRNLAKSVENKYKLLLHYFDIPL